MDQNGIDAAVLNTLNMGARMELFKTPSDEWLSKLDDPDFNICQDFQNAGQPSHELVFKLARQYPKRIYPFFWYNPRDPKDPTQEKGIIEVENGIKERLVHGVKLQLAMIPCLPADLFPISKLLVEYDLPLYFHPSGGLFCAKNTHPQFFLELAKKFPALKIIVGHSAFSMEFCIEVNVIARYIPHLYFETSLSVPYGIATYVKFFGAERVIFGTDCPSAGPFNIEFEKLMAIKLTDAQKELIFSKNIEKLLQL